MLAALLGALSLFAAAPASAQQRPQIVSASAVTYNGALAILIEFDEAPRGHHIQIQVKEETATWPSRATSPSLPSGARTDDTGLRFNQRRVVGLMVSVTYDVRAHLIRVGSLKVIEASSPETQVTMPDTVPPPPRPPQPPIPPFPNPPTSIPPTGGGAPPPAGPSDPTPDSPRCGESDREYLVRFYEATEGDAWDRNENWNSQEPLEEWFGVGTDEDGEVISLRLANNNLSEDMPTEELLCLNENTELKELALWDNEDLLGEVPEELVRAVERAVLRDIAEMLDLNPQWFEDYEDPFDFEDWHEGVTTDDEGRVVELDFTGEGVIGEIPDSLSEQLQRLRGIMITTSDGGCALSPEGSSAFSLFLLTLVVFAVLGRKRARTSCPFQS